MTQTQNATYDQITYTAPAGPTGPQGPAGPTGSTGATGPQGPQGIQGPIGPIGPGWVTSLRAPTGTDTAYPLGTLWLKTDTGAYWSLTAAGPPAVWTQQGNLTGPQGQAGVDGAQGTQGPAGAQGPAGTPGATGPQGNAGPAGPTGPSGPIGPQGSAGVQGPIGPTGAEGPQGPIGATGPQGPAGTGLNVRGTVPNAGALPPCGSGNLNDAWVANDTGHVYVCNGTSWIDVGLARGPAGPTGPQGPEGPTGPQGANGPAGPIGNTGPAGSQGGPGPQGPAGVPGPVGANGPTGPAGPQGPMGPTGPRGPQGPPGDPFATPVLGIGSVVHWRPADNTYDRYGFCKPAIVLYVPDETNNLLVLQVLGTEGKLSPFQDRVPTGQAPNHWHFIGDCSYSFSVPATLATQVPMRTNGYLTFQGAQYVPIA